jgi:SAM-dependent methyltransferase
MSKLKDMFYAHRNLYTCKFPHYMDIYDMWFTPFIGKEVTFLEVGSGVGGFLQIMKKFLGDKAKVYGIDMRDDFLFEEPQIKMFSGDQGDREFLRKVIKEIGTVDILVDDAGHERDRQIVTFEEFMPNINQNGGLYCIEDLNHTYHPDPAMSNPSFLDYMKKYLDKMNLGNHPPIIESVNFYTYLLVLHLSSEPTRFGSPRGVGDPELYVQCRPENI